MTRQRQPGLVRPRRRITQRSVLLLAVAVIALSHGTIRFRVDAQSTPVQSRAQAADAVAVTCETFCSQIRPGTSSIRLRWSLTPKAETAAVKSLADAKASIEVTVFSEGLEKGAYVTLPVPSTQPTQPVAAVAQGQQAQLRAYRIQIVEVDQPRAEIAGGSLESGVLIEGLEPGVNYTWRVVLETAAGRLVSPPVTCPAATCPTDQDEVKPPPVRKPPPRKPPPN
jgi:hypothetical protein